MIVNNLKPRDKFRFTKQSKQKLGLGDDIFTVWVRYGGPGSPRGILVRNSRTKQKIEVPADSEVIPEIVQGEESEVRDIPTEKKEKLESLRREEVKQQWRSPLSAILLAFVAMLVIYLVVVFVIVR